jgi:hypothetical protein
VTQTFVCDGCDARIETGYTVCWSRKLTDSAAGVHYSRDDKTRNLCAECFPDKNNSLADKIRQMLP